MSFVNNNKYIPYIDGCRGIAISIVVLSHAGLGNIIPGKFGVTLFFFISGFLITKLLLLEYHEKNSISLKKFYLRRFFRLYPALLGMIGVSLITASLIPCSIPLKDIIAALFYFTNYYIGWIRDPGEDCMRILDIIWSLSVEEHFYFIFPFLFIWLLKRKKNDQGRLLLYTMFALCILALLARIQLYLNNSNNISYVTGRVYFSTHTRMDSILWGCIAAVLLFKSEASWYKKMLSKNSYLAFGFLLLVLSVGIRNQAFRETLLFSFQGIGLLIIIPSLGYRKINFFMTILEHKSLIFIGHISYSLYLFHWVAAKFANSRTEEHSLNWQLIFWPMAILLSLGSYYGIEKPFVKLRRKFGSHT